MPATLATIAADHGRDLAYLADTDTVTADTVTEDLRDAVTTLQIRGHDTDAELLGQALTLLDQAAHPGHRHTGNTHVLLDQADRLLRRELPEISREYRTTHGTR
ncbi:hypothetical protein Kpho02_72840 [Kitasatospora phosalacinea]|uniref:Uncharacterized protein n=1 Tax=Kitasatospora phosalacinea TaxID=2065 RepID=A0A9W6V782_9ACTN|nr:hypothetical protein [Kitasatospora phosalacinea]GLW74987.1 hypothetical protein Kpho02_72840 [Kitasatospora phosalacinea]